MRETLTATVAIVHYRSGGMLLDLLCDLQAQEGVQLDIHVVESGDDGTVGAARASFPDLTVHEPGRNAGYAGGNNIVFGETAGSAPVLVINPDIRIPAARMVSQLLAALDNAPCVAAVAPVIRTSAGLIEYLGSRVDLRRAIVEHTDTHVPEWSATGSSLDLTWLDGACLLFRRQALDEIGGFDERFFLFGEEVDWCLRARAGGWRLLLLRDCEVTHERSSSFGGSTKGTYYSVRNDYLLCLNHADGHVWRLHWLVRLVRLSLQGVRRRTGHPRAVLLGLWHALTGRWGPAPVDRSPRMPRASDVALPPLHHRRWRRRRRCP